MTSSCLDHDSTLPDTIYQTNLNISSYRDTKCGLVVNARLVHVMKTMRRNAPLFQAVLVSSKTFMVVHEYFLYLM